MIHQYRRGEIWHLPPAEFHRQHTGKDPFCNGANDGEAWHHPNFMYLTFSLQPVLANPPKEGFYSTASIYVLTRGTWSSIPILLEHLYDFLQENSLSALSYKSLVTTDHMISFVPS